MPCFFNFPVFRARPEKKFVSFIGCNFESRAIQVGLHKQNKDTASEKKGEVSLLFYRVTVKKLECLELTTCEVVARLVASGLKRTLRWLSTCM